MQAFIFEQTALKQQELTEFQSALDKAMSVQNKLAEECAATFGRLKKQAAKWTHGKPLPLQGACKHYAHSYRWLRFPCCGATFPCDACHDEASDHVHEWATRMICGHCAREQPYHNSPCVACGRATRRGGGPAPRFWEGGGGQRNPRLMSNKDAHKFKGSAMKTKSKKKSRVGAKAKTKASSGSGGKTSASM
ncbi:hypothetical protein EON66_06980 [archaeon]|nr:MAG: hypothetical protein EON66_06980 [archaeon]